MPRETRRVALGLVLTVMAALSAPTARALEIELVESYPLRGEPATVRLTGDDVVAAQSLRVTYRPNSETMHVETLPVSGGTVDWTPRDAGIVRLEALGADEAVLQSRNVAVRFGGFPPSGVAVMVVAAVLLFGGAAVAMVALLTSPTTVEEDLEPPST